MPSQDHVRICFGQSSQNGDKYCWGPRHRNRGLVYSDEAICQGPAHVKAIQIPQKNQHAMDPQLHRPGSGLGPEEGGAAHVLLVVVFCFYVNCSPSVWPPKYKPVPFWDYHVLQKRGTVNLNSCQFSYMFAYCDPEICKHNMCCHPISHILGYSWKYRQCSATDDVVNSRETCTEDAASRTLSVGSMP